MIEENLCSRMDLSTINYFFSYVIVKNITFLLKKREFLVIKSHRQDERDIIYS